MKKLSLLRKPDLELAAGSKKKIRREYQTKALRTSKKIFCFVFEKAMINNCQYKIML